MTEREEHAGWSYHEKPYRHYRYGGSPTVNGLKICSVTQALGVIDKSGPLQHYASNKTIEGVCTLRTMRRAPRSTEPDALKRALRANGLMFYQQTQNAAERGTGVHTLLEQWIETRTIPKISDHPPEWAGYIRGLVRFIADEDPDFVESELIVGSVTHGYAGRRDTVIRTHVKGRGRALLDLKTSRAVYPGSHFRQLAAYELAGVEIGEDPTDQQGIVRIGEDGSYEVKWLQDVAPLEFFKRAFINALTTYRDESYITKAAKANG